ncbi:hypothetical protein DVH24_013425 [Malus domestica]|uniref:Uncharacterized protein n=1 Tax=Malus domestica TaxID=3750 RepID=A0A498HI62_MALDO|nr:hypothetical protein DVH24_013425 [Malus domestica]
MYEAKWPYALHVIPLCCPRVRLENLPHMRGRVENESHIDGRRDLVWAHKRLGYSPYCQLILWWNLNFLHGIREGCPTYEAKRPHALHVIPLCYPRVRLANSPHMRGRVENESHINGRRFLAWAYKRLGYSLYCQLILWWNLNFLHSIRAGCPTCEAKWPHTLHCEAKWLHMFHVTLLCCPRVRLENLPHVRGHLRMSPILMGG